MVNPEELTNDQLLYNAVLYLIQSNQEQLALMLIDCELVERSFDRNENLQLTILAPFVIASALSGDPDNLTSDSNWSYKGNVKREAIQDAFQYILRSWVEVSIHPQLITTDEKDWREHLRKIATGEKTTNQGITSPKRQPVERWQGLNFWSVVERMIAEALDRRGVMYLANCMARVGPPDHRHNQEPDFLICHNGKWGILEVDGTTYHNKTVAKDQEHDRQYQHHGVKSIQRFTALKCRENPDAVVAEFLDLLEKTG